MFLAYVPVKNGKPQEPKVVSCDDCEASLYAHEIKIGIFKTEEEAIQAAYDYWSMMVVVEEGVASWVYE